MTNYVSSVPGLAGLAVDLGVAPYFQPRWACGVFGPRSPLVEVAHDGQVGSSDPAINEQTLSSCESNTNHQQQNNDSGWLPSSGLNNGRYSLKRVVSQCTTLSGSHGEWTQEDDMPPKRVRRGVRRPGQLSRGQRNAMSRAAAVAVSSVQRVTAPTVTTAARGIRIHHREFIGDVTADTVYAVGTDYIINPADSTTFPWLSTQAKSWEKYRFHNLMFEYIPRCATSTQGQVMMIPLYDPKEQPPATEVAAASHADVIEDVVWNGVVCKLNPARLGGFRYVGTTIQAGDVRTSNAGKFMVASTGATAVAIVGKLWVEYDVELTIPLTVSTTPEFTGASIFNMIASTFPADNVWETLVSASGWNAVHDGLDIDRYMPDSGLGLFRLPRGTYLVHWFVSWSNTTSEATSVDAMFSETSTPDPLVPTFMSSMTETPIANGWNVVCGAQPVATAGDIDFRLWGRANYTAGPLAFGGYSTSRAVTYMVITPA